MLQYEWLSQRNIHILQSKPLKSESDVEILQKIVFIL